jgi:hypothetical protein
MKKWILSVISSILVFGCSTIPSEPTPHDYKYTVQILEIDIPLKSLTIEGVKNDSGLKESDIEERILNPDARVFEYPIVYAEIGISEVINQTKEVSFIHDFIIEGGKAKTQKETQKVGTIVKVTLDEVDAETVSFHIDLHTKNLAGYETIKVAGSKVKIPVFSEKQITTTLKHKVNSWIYLGSVEGTERKDKERIQKQFVMRIIPPNSTK